jgi:hypothetical protein
MADTRTFSTSSGHDAARKGSVNGMDTSHLAKVDTVVATEAARATQAEISMTLMQGIKTYPKAIGWSILLSTCIIVSIRSEWRCRRNVES